MRADRARRQPAAGIAVAAKLHRHADGVARVYIDLFGKEIWEPFDKAGRPEADWPKVREALDRMRPLASDALLAMFQITMGEATEKAGERTLQEAAKPTQETFAAAVPRGPEAASAASRLSRSALSIGFEVLSEASVTRSTAS